MWWVARIGSLCPKFRYFTDQNRPKGEPHESEFWPITNIKMNVTNSYSRRSRWKNGAICLVSILSSWVMVLKLFRKVHFVQFCAEPSQMPKCVKTIYMDLEVLITVFQKMIWLIWVRASSKISKKMLTQQKLTKFFDFKH